jgi:hypothetical protein
VPPVAGSPNGHEARIVGAIANEAGARRRPLDSDGEAALAAPPDAAPARPPSPGTRVRRARDGWDRCCGRCRDRRVGQQRDRPSQFAMAVSGAQLAPGADGLRVTDENGLGLADRVFGERRAASGERALLPGLAEERRRGCSFRWARSMMRSTVILWSGVPVTRFRALSVTQLLANGNPVSARRRVLIGRITASG